MEKYAQKIEFTNLNEHNKPSEQNQIKEQMQKDITYITINSQTCMKIFISMVLPLSKTAIAAQAIFWFVGIWNDFFAPSIYLTGDVKTLQVYLNSLLSANASGIELPLLMAGSVLASLPMILIFFCFQNFFVNSIAISGMKE
jgi:multiple sugar transport system permease protein